MRMKFFGTSAARQLNKFTNKAALGCLVLMTAPLFSSFREPVLNANENHNSVEPEATNLIYQSIDGGKTWQDISRSLPAAEEPEDFFAGESGLYLRMNGLTYRSQSKLNAPDWEKVNVLPPDGSIAFNPSGVMAFNYDGQVYQETASTGTWLPMYPNFRTRSMRTVFETSDGTVFMGYDGGLLKSADRGESWERVHDQGWVINMVESDGVLMATGQRGIMRSTDNGEHWEWVLSEGGVGIAIESIKGGFAAISANTKTKSRRIHISLDKGKTWKAIDDGLRPSLFVSSIKQIGGYLICGHPDGIYRSSDHGQTWMLVHPPVDQNEFIFRTSLSDPYSDRKKVFKVYVSGHIVYAVAGGAGC